MHQVLCTVDSALEGLADAKHLGGLSIRRMVGKPFYLFAPLARNWKRSTLLK